jgi:ALMS motif
LTEKGILTERSDGEKNNCSNADTDTDVKEERQKRRKPIAFYLPVDNASPIIIGSRILREKNLDDFIGKENRSILANYMAGIESGMTKLKRRPEPARTPDSSKHNPASLMTLQESLARKRPDFVARADYRTQRLAEMKQKRLEYEEQVEIYLLYILLGTSILSCHGDIGRAC